jgi:hypothetical protein
MESGEFARSICSTKEFLARSILVTLVYSANAALRIERKFKELEDVVDDMGKVKIFKFFRWERKGWLREGRIRVKGMNRRIYLVGAKRKAGPPRGDPTSWSSSWSCRNCRNYVSG